MKTSQNVATTKAHGQDLSHGSFNHTQPWHAHNAANHSAVNLRDATGHLHTARAGQFITRHDDGKISVSSTAPSDVPTTAQASTPETSSEVAPS